MIADGDQRSVLLRLHDQLDESRAELSGSEIAAGFKPTIDPLIIDAAQNSLVQAGLVISVGRNPSRYRISRAGITEVERHYDISTTINPSTGIVHRSYSEKPGSVLELNPTFDWGKWGAIAGWLGIPIAIIGIAVAIWLDN